MTLTYSEISCFGKMTCTNGRKKGFKNFRWEANRSKDREFSPKVMNYFSYLLNNIETLCIGVLKERLDIKPLFEKACDISRSLDEGIFSLRFISFFYDKVEKHDHATAWQSYVVDLKEHDICLWSENACRTKEFMTAINNVLESEWEYLKSSTDHGLMLDENSGMFEKITDKEEVFFVLKCLSTDKELYSHYTGLLAMLHSWYITNIELSSAIEYDFCSLVNSNSVQQLRLLVLIWILSNDTNMHLYVDF